MNIQILNSSVACGSRPEIDSDFISLTDYTVVLNLQYGWFEFFHGITNRETMMALQYKLLPVRIEMSDFTPPTFHELDACLRIISTYKTYFHCKYGKDRTGMVRAAFRVKQQGWTTNSAINEMTTLGMHKIYQPLWIPHFREYIARTLTEE